MPFSKYDVDPAHIEVMRAAFHRVYEMLQLNCGPQDIMTDLVALRIVEHVKAGEFEVDLLCRRVLQELKGRPGSAAGNGLGPPAN